MPVLQLQPVSVVFPSSLTVAVVPHASNLKKKNMAKYEAYTVISIGWGVQSNKTF